MHLHKLLTNGSIDRDLLPEELHLLIRHHLDVQPTNSIAVAQLLHLHLHLQLLSLVLLLLVLPLHPPLLLFCTSLVLRLHSQLTHLAISIYPLSKAKGGRKEKQKALNWKQRSRGIGLDPKKEEKSVKSAVSLLCCC